METDSQEKGEEAFPKKESSSFSDSVRKPVSKKNNMFFIVYIHQQSSGEKRNSSVSNKQGTLFTEDIN